MHFIEEDRFLFARRNFDGTHYIYRRTNEDWVIDHTISGFTEIHVSVSDVPDTPSNREKGFWVRLEYAGESPMFVLLHNQSHGYETYNDEHVLHFTVTEQDGERVPGVELLTGLVFLMNFNICFKDGVIYYQLPNGKNYYQGAQRVR